MIQTKGYAAQAAKEALAPFSFERRDPGPSDVAINIDFCGVCHSDIHQARGEWSPGVYPLVPGHEIVGRVASIGPAVTKFKTGDLVGVGCLVDSCRTCDSCRHGEEQFCLNGATYTYGAPDQKSGGQTYGGYSNKIVVDEAFVLKISSKLELAAVAPLLCAGITTYSPMRRFGVGPEQKVGVVGLGGLAHMALKLAHSFGAQTVLFTTSESKKADALRLGADQVVLSRNEDEIKAHTNSFDFMIDTVSAPHDINVLLGLLKRGGNLVLVGLPVGDMPVAPANLIFARRSFTGSLIGGLQETQEMLDYCAAHGIVSDIELIPIQRINEAFDRTVKADVKYRFVIDMKSLN